MPEENSTWDSVTATPEPALDAPVVDPPAENPPAEASTLEKPDAPQLEAVPAPPREDVSEQQITPEPKEEVKTEEYVHEDDDPPEIAALPTPAAKRWAKRQFQDASTTRAFLDFDKPITALGDDLYQRSPSRYTEHVNDLVTRHAEHVSKQLFGVSYDEAKTRLQANAQPTSTTTPAAPITAGLPGPSAPILPVTAEELEAIPLEQIAERFSQIQTAQTENETKLREENKALAQQFEALKEQLEAVTGEITTEKNKGFQAEIVKQQNKLLDNVWSVVEEGIRTSGLEVQPTDPPKIQNLKRAALRLLDKQPVFAAFDAVVDNQRVVKYVVEAINRREFQNAFREEDNLKVRARAAFESVKNSPEVKEILGEIESYANQSRNNSRGANPIPPAPGSSVGVNIKPPATWDEAVAGAAS